MNTKIHQYRHHHHRVHNPVLFDKKLMYSPDRQNIQPQVVLHQNIIINHSVNNRQQQKIIPESPIRIQLNQRHSPYTPTQQIIKCTTYVDRTPSPFHKPYYHQYIQQSNQHQNYLYNNQDSVYPQFAHSKCTTEYMNTNDCSLLMSKKQNQNTTFINTISTTTPNKSENQNKNSLYQTINSNFYEQESINNGFITPFNIQSSALQYTYEQQKDQNQIKEDEKLDKLVDQMKAKILEDLKNQVNKQQKENTDIPETFSQLIGKKSKKTTSKKKIKIKNQESIIEQQIQQPQVIEIRTDIDSCIQRRLQQQYEVKEKQKMSQLITFQDDFNKIEENENDINIRNDQKMDIQELTSHWTQTDCQQNNKICQTFQITFDSQSQTQPLYDNQINSESQFQQSIILQHNSNQQTFQNHFIKLEQSIPHNNQANLSITEQLNLEKTNMSKNVFTAQNKKQDVLSNNQQNQQNQKDQKVQKDLEQQQLIKQKQINFLIQTLKNKNLDKIVEEDNYLKLVDLECSEQQMQNQIIESDEVNHQTTSDIEQPTFENLHISQMEKLDLSGKLNKINNLVKEFELLKTQDPSLNRSLSSKKTNLESSLRNLMCFSQLNSSGLQKRIGQFDIIAHRKSTEGEQQQDDKRKEELFIKEHFEISENKLEIEQNSMKIIMEKVQNNKGDDKQCTFEKYRKMKKNE